MRKQLQDICGSHDLRLSQWGPYSQKYLGISHIPDIQAGIRFDLSVFPGLYRRTAVCPTAKRDVGVYNWEAAPDLSYYRLRHELIWKDRLYCDTDYCRLDENAVLIGAHLVNNTELMQPIALQYMASLNFPPLRPQHTEILHPCQAELPDGAVWVDAIAYAKLYYNRPDHREHLTPDGHLRGEIRANGFVGGTALGQKFGLSTGDQVSYHVQIPRDIPDAVLIVRYRVAAGQEAVLHIYWLAQEQPANAAAQIHMQLSGNGEITAANMPIGNVVAGEHSLTFTTQGGVEVQLDGFVICPQTKLAEVSFPAVVWNPVPERLPGPQPESLILRYEHVNCVYGMAWENLPFEVRNILDDELEPWAHRMCIGALHNLNPTFTGKGAGHFTNVCLRPVMLPPGTEQTLYGLVCTGDVDNVRNRLAEFAAEKNYAAMNQRARAHRPDLRGNLAGSDYLFSQERMAATTLTNVIYPVRTRGSYIKHYTPGRFYETVYTWDAGFIGLGLLELDPERALDMLNAYLTKPGEPDAAFIHHGTPLPTQFYLFWELWNHTRSTELLDHFYPRLQQYHRFLAGRYGGSTTRNLQSQLLRTWDYFYNSGGWDDYPPQAYVHANRLTSTVASVVNTAHAVRTAKMLRFMAAQLNLDTSEYDEDIACFSAAIQRWSWDTESGYFGYVRHDAQGRPQGILKHESGSNFNMGLDGVTPLVADICTPEQETSLLSHIFTPGRLWSPHGISSVDQTAPYYQDDGYWNGSVWMPHQWFIWKALLDLGRADEAHRIASTGLDVWKREVEDTYACWEHVNVKTGRGGGWHQFSALSTPVLCWYGAYFRPGRITGGLNLHVAELKLSDGNQSMHARLAVDGQARHTPTVIATLRPAPDYRITWNGASAHYLQRYPGTLEITLPAGSGEGVLDIKTPE